MANTDKKIRETSSVVLPCDKKEKNKNGIDCEVIKFDFNVFIMIVRDLFCDVGTFVFLIVVKLKIYRMDSIYKMLW